jgi:hypothetical protein
MLRIVFLTLQKAIERLLRFLLLENTGHPTVRVAKDARDASELGFADQSNRT